MVGAGADAGQLKFEQGALRVDQFQKVALAGDECLLGDGQGLLCPGDQAVGVQLAAALLVAPVEQGLLEVGGELVFRFLAFAMDCLLAFQCGALASPVLVAPERQIDRRHDDERIFAAVGRGGHGGGSCLSGGDVVEADGQVGVFFFAGEGGGEFFPGRPGIQEVQLGIVGAQSVEGFLLLVFQEGTGEDAVDDHWGAGRTGEEGVEAGG